MTSPEEIYLDFASKISFLEFIQEEFRKTDLPVNKFKKEISLLMAKKQWNIDALSDYVKNNPQSFLIFQEIFQLLRFTNAQLIHFVFDIVKLNSNNINAIYEYMILNLKHDVEFRNIYLKLIDSNIKYEDLIANLNKYSKKYLVANFKVTVSQYISNIVKNFNILKRRITKSEFEDFSIRFSHYLLNNLQLNKILAAIDVEKFIQNKKIPVDIKKLHGNYPKIKIKRILDDNGYHNIDGILNNYGLRTLKHNLNLQIDKGLIKNNKIFCTERFIEGIIKTRDNKPKKFDLIIFSNYRPKYLFEINFYSTEGTKIGINQNEYIDLNSYIKNKFRNFEFYWITDGNYWLTHSGKARFINLLNYFDKILNINLFAEYLSNLK